MNKTKNKLIAILIIITILMNYFSTLLGNAVYATSNYTITFEGAHAGNGEQGYEQNDVIYYYFEETFFNHETQQEEINKQYIRVRIEENTPQGWVMTNLFSTDGENQIATLELEDGEDINTKYRINIEGNIIQNFNVFVNDEKVPVENLQVTRPNPDPEDDYTVTLINMPITNGMKINLTKRIIKTIVFNSNPTLVNDTTLSYTNEENAIILQLGTRENNGEGGYNFTPVQLTQINDAHGNEELHSHIEAQIEAASLEGYYFLVSNQSEVEASALINGNEIPNEWLEFDETNPLEIWITLANIDSENTNVDIIIGNNNQGPGQGANPIEPPEIKAGYITANMQVALHASGQINYFFVNASGKYLDKDGNVLTEQKEPAGAITSVDEIKEATIPNGTVKVLIGLEGGRNSDFYNINRCYNDHDFETINKDDVNHGNTIEYAYNENDAIAIILGIEYRNNGFYPEEKGTYLVANFSGNDDAVVKYIDLENNEQTLTNANYAPENVLSIPKLLTMQITKEQLDHLQIDIYDENLELIEREAGNIALLLADEEDETRNFEKWIGKLINGDSATLNLGALNTQDYTFVVTLNLRDPREAEYAHVFTWTNMKGTGWPDDALIDGGFARIVKAYDKNDNLIYDANEEYDETHYVRDNRGELTNKYFYGDLMSYEWERGPMYPFAIIQDSNGGEVEAIEGIKLVVELVPVYGKQLVGVSLGERAGIAETENAKYYTVTMPPRHTHFNAQFKDINNEALLKEGIAVSQIVYELEDKALDSGTAVLSIDKVENLSEDKKQAFAQEAGANYTVETYLDVDLTQVWFKGVDATFGNNGYSEDEVWTKEIYDLGDKKATITVTLDEGITPDDVIILHEIHDEKGLVTDYETVTILNKEKGEKDIWTITFETSKFSNYAIATRTYKVFNYEDQFKDVKATDWYYNAIKFVYENNIIKGYNATTFAPNDKLTRGQLVTILHRMEGSPKVTATSKFSDVQDSSKYYYNAVIWATNQKIVSGYDNGKFGAEDNITREQLAVILWKYAKYKGKDVSASNDLKGFGDTNKISSWALTQVKWAVGVGVITGNKNTNPPTINPLGNATRAEVAAMLEKYCKKVGR